MAGIVSATPAQALAARDSLMKLVVYLQQYAQGSLATAKTPAALVTLVDAAVDDAVAKLAPLNTSDGYPVMYWTPMDLFGLGSQGFWYDPSDLSTLFQDIAGTIPVTAVGQPVALMRDKSGHNNHVSISVPASRPILRQNATTGAYYLETDGADDYMVSAPIDLTGTDSVALFCGIRKLTDVAASMLLEFSSNATTTPGAFYVSAPESPALASVSFKSMGSLSTNPSNARAPAPVSLVVTALGKISTDTQTVRLNGAIAATAANDQGTGNYSSQPLYLFRREGTTLPWAGYFYGLIGVGRLTTATETLHAERWLARKVGVTL